jgi:hypothetical protein
VTAAIEYLDEDLVLLPKQIEMVQYQEKWGASRGGNGSGKTTAWVYWLWLERMEAFPESNFVAVGATYKQLREGLFDTYRDVLQMRGLEDNGVDFTYRRNVPWLQLKNGAKLHAWSAEAALRVKSANVQTLIIEEPQTWGPSAEAAWTSLSTRLRHNELSAGRYPDLEPQGRISFNPTGVAQGHWLYKLLEESWPKRHWRCWQLSSRENSLLLRVDPGYVRNMEAAISEDRWAVEIDGHYATRGGGVYRLFDAGEMSREHPKLPLIAYNKQLPLMLSLDFNFHKMCAAIMQPYHQKQISLGFDHRNLAKIPQEMKQPEVDGYQQYVVTAIDEIVLRKAGAEQVAEEFVRRYRADDPFVYVYGDPSGGNASHVAGGKSAWEAVFEVFDRVGLRYERRIENSNLPGSVLNRINYANLFFKNDGRIGFRVDPVACVEVCADFQGVNFLPGKNEVDKRDPERTHMADAVTYCLYVERRIRLAESVEFKSFMGR